MRPIRLILLATVCLFAAVPAAILGGGAAALAATGRPTVIAGTNTFDGNGGTIVRGYVTPNGSQVSECHFEYGATEAYGQVAACEGEPGSGSEPVEVTMDAQGLSAGSTYHFRLVATNSWGASESEDSVFVAPAEEPHRSCPNAGMAGVGLLPDCRAWEMVSSNAKGGADVTPIPERSRTATDGSAVTYFSLGGFGDVIGNGAGFEYMGVRSESTNPGDQGWATHGITPPQPSASFDVFVTVGAETHYVDFEGFSSDLNKAVTVATRPITEEPMVKNVIANLYLRDDLRTSGHGDYTLLTACPICTVPLAEDDKRVARFAGATPDYSHIIFESQNNLTEGASGIGRKLYEWHEGILSLVSKAPDGSTLTEATAGRPAEAAQYATPTLHAISADGSKIFFQSASGTRPENLYMREDGTRTVQLNVSERTPPDTTAPAEYVTASEDGSRVFFTSTEALTNDAPVGGNKLYMYNTTLAPEDPHNLTLVAPEAGVFGASEDGSYVYFQRGASLNVWHEGNTSLIGFIAPTELSYVSPTGGFMFRLASKNGEPVGPGFKQRCSHNCVEAFSYLPATRQLECVSCNQSAGDNEGEVRWNVGEATSGAETSGHQDRPLTDNGKYAFFTSPAALVPNDTNGVADAYVYDTQTGRVSLLSSGESSAKSFFMEATPSGNDAFFVTRDQLVGWDSDGNFDLYDARIGGGFPEPPLPPPGCEGDACQPAPVSFSDPTPASATFAGSGNLNPIVGKALKRKPHKKARKRKHRRHAAAKRARSGR